MSTSVDILDDDHEQLLYHLQNVAYSDEMSQDDIKDIISHVREHFDHEQPYLALLGGELERRHAFAHACFIRKLEEIAGICEEAPEAARADLIGVLAQFISHTNTDDQEIDAALRRRGIVAA
ncbi:hypothetical protein [Azospirillum halopraeferens]|uniref:hypothetical protein n=1 Tax=Azospirillum halopraeferens TaxID=34010 RepID=UPI000402ACFC|nr:hypothetical protein [Azospirillum halopraeferens]